jgi:hypothetical protein
MLLYFYGVKLDVLDTKVYGLLPKGFYVSFAFYKVDPAGSSIPVSVYQSAMSGASPRAKVDSKCSTSVWTTQGKSDVCVVMVSSVV